MITTLIVGTGAVDNSWNPVIRIIQLLFPAVKISRESANAYLARQVYKMRWGAIKSQENLEIYTQEEHIEECRKFSRLKEMIAKEISDAERSSELRPRENFIDVFRNIFTFSSSQFYLGLPDLLGSV